MSLLDLNPQQIRHLTIEWRRIITNCSGGQISQSNRGYFCRSNQTKEFLLGVILIHTL